MTPRRKKPPAPKHLIDWKQASTWLSALHGETETELRLINAKGKVISKWGDLLDISDPDHPALAELQRLNDNGFNAYAVINSPNPEAGARIRAGLGSIGDNDITAATALFVDIDRDETRPGENLELLQDAEVPPSLIVQSSAPHKVHGYWLVDDLADMSLWRRLQVQLIAHFGADPVCRNPSRIMRIPGFWHHKQEPIQTRLIAHPNTIYGTLELAELFNLDPELDPEPTPYELPSGHTPPAVDLLLRRPFTHRVTKKVHTTDKGRHHAVLWWAQHLRENGINKTDAINTAQQFASMLPDRHIEGPIPADEIIDAINWAYAKNAGKNPPVRQTGLETVAIASSGNSSGGGGSGSDDLDEITQSSARPPITIQAGGYARVKDTKDGPTYTQLTNWTFTPQLDLTWPDRNTGQRGTLTINGTHHHTIDLPSKAWTSRRDLLNHIGGYKTAIFTNTNADIAQIQQFILTNYNNLPNAHGVTTYGLHKHNNTWIGLYDAHNNPHLFYAGTPVDPGAYQAPQPGTPNQIQAAKNTIKALPHLITSAAALAALGYACAAAYAPRITPALGDRLPFLYLTGERESGKSSSIELILTLTAGNATRLRKAPGLTPYQYDSAFANLNNRLAALDEYRPGAIDDAQLRKHHDLGSKYRGSGVAGKEHAYHLNSPLIVAGEGFTEDAAALSRGPLYFIEKQHRGETRAYLNVTANPNWAYAHHLEQTARTLPEPQHQERLQHAWHLARQATNNRGGPRLEFALAFIAYGLQHLQDEIPGWLSDEAIIHCLEVGVAQTLEGGTESKTNLETFLEQLGSAVSEHKDPQAIITPGATYGSLLIRLSPAVELVKRRYKDPAISNPRLLRQYASKVDWIDTDSPIHKDSFNTPVRSIKLWLDQVPDRCDVSALEYLEGDLRATNR